MVSTQSIYGNQNQVGVRAAGHDARLSRYYLQTA